MGELFARDDVSVLAPLGEAIRYSLLAPGKRFRPVLALSAAQLWGTDLDRVVDIGVAFELIHAYSLVHDDLPCMDDDDLRRGVPTNHRVYGEGVAVLVGDALQSEAFRLIACADAVGAGERAELVQLLATAAGWSGMVGGQYLDIQSTDGDDSAHSVSRLRELHGRKTGALIAASVEAGAIVGGASADERDVVREFGVGLGWLFQLVDDLLDEVGEVETTGKASGSDRRAGKVTAFDIFGGADALGVEADMQLDRCLEAAAALPQAGGLLPELARFVRTRDR
jgi:geranylgeranyl pyrophosphate synthase